MIQKTGFIMAGIFALNSISFAQPGTTPELGSYVTDITRDVQENDPSEPGTQLALKKPINQEALMVTGAGRHITSNIDNSFAWAKWSHRLGFDGDLKGTDLSKSLLGIHSHRYTPTLEHGPAMVNANFEFTGISDRKYGYCWGFATLNRYFTHLAFFDKTLPPLKNLKEVKDRIDEVLAGKGAIFPGYGNFRELSLNPEIELYLKLNVMELWRNRAMRPSSISIFTESTNYMSFDEVETLLKDLEKRLGRGEMPKIIFSALIPSHKAPFGINPDIHVVLVHKVERGPNHTAKIHLWDINYYTETLSESPKIIRVTPTHGFLYDPWLETDTPYAEGSALLGRVIISPEEDIEMSQILDGLEDFCKKKENKKYCKKHSIY